MGILNYPESFIFSNQHNPKTVFHSLSHLSWNVSTSYLKQLNALCFYVIWNKFNFLFPTKTDIIAPKAVFSEDHRLFLRRWCNSSHSAGMAPTCLCRKQKRDIILGALWDKELGQRIWFIWINNILRFLNANILKKICYSDKMQLEVLKFISAFPRKEENSYCQKVNFNWLPPRKSPSFLFSPWTLQTQTNPICQNFPVLEILSFS